MVRAGDYIKIRESDELEDSLKEFGGRVCRVTGVSQDDGRIVTDITGMHVLKEDDVISLRECNEYTDLEKKLLADNDVLQGKLKDVFNNYTTVKHNVVCLQQDMDRLEHMVETCVDMIRELCVTLEVRGTKITIGVPDYYKEHD